MGSMRRCHSRLSGFACALGLVYSLTGCLADMGDRLPPDAGSEGGTDDAATTDSGGSSSDVAAEGSDDAQQALIDKGKIVFLTAGGVGCSSCHGTNAEGLPGNGPNIRGKTETQIIDALTTVKPMAVLKYPTGVTPADVHAVAAYLGWLATQPP